MTIFQTIDDKEECVGLYTDGKLHFDNFPSGLTKTWKYSGSLLERDVEYGWIYAEGKTLAEAAPEDLQKELEAAERKMSAYRKSFHIAKINLHDHCIFDLVPHTFLMEFCEIKNKITHHVFQTYDRPPNYDHMQKIHKLLHKISYQQLNLNLDDCKHLMYGSMARTKIQELLKNHRYIHYNPYGTITGRLTTAYGSFPVLTIKKEFRQLLKPNNDVFVSFDYNGAEVRTFLDLCEAQQPPGDIHVWNINNIFKDEDITRDEAKTLFFAWLYNPESNEIQTEIYNREKLLDKHYINGYINTPSGRKIKVDTRKALNYLIQSTTSDRILSKAILIDEFLKERKSFISHIVHDEIVIDYHDDDRSVLKDIKMIFEGGYLSNVKIGKDYYQLNALEL